MVNLNLKLLKLDIIFCSFNMRHEIRNTVISCLPPYQKGVDIGQYSIIIVDNGSNDGTSYREVSNLSPNIKCVKYPTATVSPAPAMNWAVKNFSHSEQIVLCIDGARMFSDNLISNFLRVHSFLKNAFVYTLGYHIGDKTHQQLTAEKLSLEDGRKYLDDLHWLMYPENLKKNSVFAMSSSGGHFKPIAESNAFSIRREEYLRSGGFDERFVTPGGGLCNLEIFQRFVGDPNLLKVCLLNDGNYHQYHGGGSTGMKIDSGIYMDEYKSIFEKDFQVEEFPRFYF